MQCSAPWEEIWFRIWFHITSIHVFFLLRQMEGGGGRYGGRQTDSEVDTAALQLGKKKNSYQSVISCHIPLNFFSN